MVRHYSSIENNIPLVADASVIINLIASGVPEKIISSFPNSVFVVDDIKVELARDKRNKCSDLKVLNELIKREIIKCVSLEGEQWEVFEKLVCGSSGSTLDDGEAATIAYCSNKASIAVIDERKANKICREYYPNLRVLSSVDLFSKAETHKLNTQVLSDAVFNALFVGRMRVMDHNVKWVIDIVGSERLKKCNSIARRFRTPD
uniref:PIN domain-containing protein n=1 Tax=OCS116 cluster bacterium TaxID=2030921 RepID=A0A2A4Z6H0_9PROT